MAEITLYMTERDEIQFVRFALEQGCWLIPDLYYPSSRYECISSERQFKEFRQRTRLFFIARDDFFKFPFVMRRIRKNGAEVYFIMQRSRGPCIDFLGGGAFLKNGGKFIRPGMIGYYPTYWDIPEPGRDMKAPAELVSLYKKFMKFIKANAIHGKLGKTSFWLMRDAQEEVKNGAKPVGLEEWPTEEILASKTHVRSL